MAKRHPTAPAVTSCAPSVMRAWEARGLPIGFGTWAYPDEMTWGYLTSVKRLDFTIQPISPLGQLGEEETRRFADILYFEDEPDYAERLERLKAFVPNLREEFEYAADRRAVYRILKHAQSTREIIRVRVADDQWSKTVQVVKCEPHWVEVTEYDDLMRERSRSFWRKPMIVEGRWRTASEEAEAYLRQLTLDSGEPWAPGALERPSTTMERMPAGGRVLDTLKAWRGFDSPVGLGFRYSADRYEWGYLCELTRDHLVIDLVSTLGELEGRESFKISEISFFQTDPTYAKRLRHLAQFSKTATTEEDLIRGRSEIQIRLAAAVETGELIQVEIKHEDYWPTVRVLGYDPVWVWLAEYDDLMREISRSLYRTSMIKGLQWRTAHEEAEQLLLGRRHSHV